jgi:hypothetical protein
LLKVVFIALAGIFVFVLPFVAMKKPFNPKAVGFIAAFILGLLGFTFLKGWYQFGSIVLLIGLVALTFFFRVPKRGQS